MKKNILMGLVCPAMALAAVATPVFAAHDPQSTQVAYTVAGTEWTFSVPATQNFNNGLEYTNQLVEIKPAVDGTVIALDNNTKITIKLHSNNGFKLNGENNASSQIPYTVDKGEAAFTGDTDVLVFTAGTSNNKGISQGLNFKTTADNIKKATVTGTHSDTIVFTATVTP